MKFQNRVFVVYAEYTDTHRENSLGHLKKLLTDAFPKTTVEFVIVDTSGNSDSGIDGKSGASENAAVETVIAGDNECRDFTAYDKGWIWLLQNRNVDARDIVVLANDSFYRHKKLQD